MVLSVSCFPLINISSSILYVSCFKKYIKTSKYDITTSLLSNPDSIGGKQKAKQFFLPADLANPNCSFCALDKIFSSSHSLSHHSQVMKECSLFFRS